MRTNKSIIFISPSKKYPGGIYHYTIKTALEFKKYLNVQIISFRKQYPEFLYPGSEKEEDILEFKIKDEFAILDWYNYFSWRSAMDIIKQKADIVYIPWWTLILAFPILYLTRASKKNGLKTIIEFHNIFDHESGLFKKQISILIIRKIAKYADLILLHTKENLNKLEKILKFKFNSLVLPLALLDDFKKSANLDEIYEIYNLNKNKKYILMFGVVRKYKGLKYAITALNYLKEDVYSEYHLLVIGEIWMNLREENALISKYHLENKIRIINKFIPDSHIMPLFEIAEIIIYPYSNATQSGSLNFAFENKKPVVATNVGGFKEIIKHEINGLLVPPNNAYELASKIKILIHDKELSNKIASNGHELFKKHFSWDKNLNEIRKFLDA